MKKLERRNSSIPAFRSVPQECNYPIVDPDAMAVINGHLSHPSQVRISERRSRGSTNGSQTLYQAADTQRTWSGSARMESESSLEDETIILHNGSKTETSGDSGLRRRPSLPARIIKKFKQLELTSPAHLQQGKECTYPIYSPPKKKLDRRHSVIGQRNFKEKRSSRPNSGTGTPEHVTGSPVRTLGRTAASPIRHADYNCPVYSPHSSPKYERHQTAANQRRLVRGVSLGHHFPTGSKRDLNRSLEVRGASEEEPLTSSCEAEDPESMLEDRRPSLEELQEEDVVRRPSVTYYQLEDSDHPDIMQIQAIVDQMKW